MVCLRNEQRSFCHFWDCTQVLHFRLFCWLWGQANCLPGEPQEKPNTMKGKHHFFFFYRACLLLFPADTGKTYRRNSRQYECVYKCSCGLVSERRPGVQTSGKPQDSTLSSTIAKLFLPGFLTLLKPRALEAQGKDENFILCFCFSQRPADLERWMVASGKDQEVYPWRLGSGSHICHSQCFPLRGNLFSWGLASVLWGQGARLIAEETSFFITQAGKRRVKEEGEGALHDWVLINYQSWQWRECEKQNRKVKKKKKKKSTL